ncbi:MAG: DUF3343 domain-containing protein [Oscillospiraceae bacterium]|nr:DUF3343 domain-containing protein [Oscillospiraceae bacterium]
MADYVATFHTHLAALRSCRALTQAGAEARMAPVPRVLSSSCGTCVFYRGTEPMESCMDQDLEAVYRREGGDYRLVCRGTE